MTKVHCSIPEQYVNPLFEVFEGGDLILSSFRDIERPLTEMQLFLDETTSPDGAVEDAVSRLRAAMEIVGVQAEISTSSIADEDWKFAYRRHFKTEAIGRRLLIVPEWELDGARDRAGDRMIVTLDPGMAFGTGKHETTRACLEYIDELSAILPRPSSFLDMGCGSGILSIAAEKLGFSPVKGFDVDQEAVDASLENAEKNDVKVEYVKFALGRGEPAFGAYDLVAANILGPLLIRFADEIAPYVKRNIVISGILAELYPEVLAAYVSRGFREVSRKTIGEWTTGLLEVSH